MKNVSLGRWFCGHDFYALTFEYEASHLVLTLSMLAAMLGFWLINCTFILKMPYFHAVCSQPLYLRRMLSSVHIHCVVFDIYMICATQVSSLSFILILFHLQV
jgi:hypothetical protein